jgi:hypothetical protein
MGLSLAAMVADVTGYLPPAAGALVQEAIDVAVIANALRTLGGAADSQPAREEFGRRFRAEHGVLLPDVDRLRAIADKPGPAIGPCGEAGAG